MQTYKIYLQCTKEIQIKYNTLHLYFQQVDIDNPLQLLKSFLSFSISYHIV